MNALRSFGRGLAHRQGATLNLALAAAAVLQIAAVALALGGCKNPSVATGVAVATTASAKAAALVSTTAQKVIAVNTAIPAFAKGLIADLISAHPEAKADLETLANALESAAQAGTDVLEVVSVINTALPWLEHLPEVGGLFAGLQGILQSVAAVEPLTTQGIVEIGELIKSYA